MPFKSSTYLVPVLKGAVDPRKGVIFRTYYIRPEKLQQMIKKAQEIPAKSYLLRIPNYDKVEQTVNTKDITNLRKLFPKDSNIWQNIHKRSQTFDAITSHKEKRSRLNQATYAYVLTQDKVYQKTIRDNFKNSKTKTDFQLITKTKKQKGLKRKKRNTKVKEQAVEPLTFPLIPKLPFKIIGYEKTKELIENNIIPEEPHENKELGNIVTYKLKVSNIKDPVNFGNEFSKFLNYVNPHPNKIVGIISQFISSKSLKDASFVTHNLSLLPKNYFANKEFWIALLGKLLVDVSLSDDLSNFQRNVTLYHALILKRMDGKRYTEIIDSLNTVIGKQISSIERNNKSLETILFDVNLDASDKASVLAALHKENALRYKDMVISVASSIDYNDGLILLSGLAIHLLPADIMASLTTFDSKLLKIGHGINEIYNIQLENSKPTLQYFLLQLLIAKVEKLHYVPYQTIQYIQPSVFTPIIIIKILRNYINLKGDELAKFIVTAKNNISDKINSNKIDVFLPLPKKEVLDGQLYRKARPLEAVYMEPRENTIKLTVKKQNIISMREDRAIIVNPVKAIV